MTDQQHKSLVQQQFGRSANDYASSDIHAAGESLRILLDMVNPRDSWHAVDVATGAGHTAMAFAPLVGNVIATDITDPMLKETRQLAKQRKIENLTVMVADAESLPFDDNTFDLLTCRLAFHHFKNQTKALAEFARVLKPGGSIGFTDNYTVEDPVAADFYNRFERLRDPSHHKVCSTERLKSLFDSAGFTDLESKKLTKEFEFHEWADRQRVCGNDKAKLLQMLAATPRELLPLLKPRKTAVTSFFSLAEIVIVAKFGPKL